MSSTITETQVDHNGKQLGRVLVELDHVNKWYGDLHVLKDVSLKVRQGEVVVMLGPSGSGKSTTCRTINRLERIDEGTILIDGQPLPQEGRELQKLRQQVGMVFQSYNLFAHLSILDLRFISVVENEKNELVAFGITMPSIVRALQKCRGKLFPFGWWHVLKSLFWRREEGVEMLLVGVLPEYQNTGINSLVQADMFRKYTQFGVKWAETNAILETNTKNQGQFKDYNPECKKRRRSYIKKLEY